MTSDGDKQRAERVPFVLKVDYPNRQTLADATENLSRSGLFIQTNALLTKGEVIPLSLSFPGLLEPVQVTGRVAWIRPAAEGWTSGVGVAVESEADRAVLARLFEPVRGVPAQGFRVLLVEDNPHLIDLLNIALKKLAGSTLKGKNTVEVQHAADGQEALSHLAEGRFDLIITDLYMPGVDGFALIKKVRADPASAQVPVIAISGADERARAQALQGGANIFLRKPVKFVQVLDTVKQLLRIE